MAKSVALRYVQKYYPEVTRVQDAKRGTKITVGPKDCANGVGKAANLCAIAKAAMRRYDGAIISLSRAYLVNGTTATRYAVPLHVTKELVVFDRSHNFEPGVYQLERIQPKDRLGVKPRGTDPKSKKPKKATKAKHYTEGVRALNSHGGKL